MARKSPSRPNKTQRNTARHPRNAREHSDGTSTLQHAGGSPAIVPMLGGLVIIVAYVLGMQMYTSEDSIADEGHHHPQIAAFIDGRFDGVGRNGVTMLPGYHAIVAAVAWGVGTHSASTVRILSAILCLPIMVLFFLCARALGKDNRVSLTLLFLLCPLVYPYFFLIYTDIPALMFLLGALFLTLTRRYQLAGLVVWLAILVRQTNVVWAFFLALVALGQDGVWEQLVRHNWRSVLQAVARLWLFVLAGLAFLVFVYWNGGAALGTTQAQHELERLYPTQGYLWLFVMFFLFMPLHLWNVPRIVTMLRRRPALWVVMSAGAFVVYLETFWVLHQWNYNPWWLRNRLLTWLRQDAWNPWLAFLPMLWAIVSLCVTPFARRSFYWMYPVAILSVVPFSLIEPRYFMVPLVFFMLFAEWKNVYVDRLTIAMYALVSVWVYVGIQSGEFFP